MSYPWPMVTVPVGHQVSIRLVINPHQIGKRRAIGIWVLLHPVFCFRDSTLDSWMRLPKHSNPHLIADATRTVSRKTLRFQDDADDNTERSVERTR